MVALCCVITHTKIMIMTPTRDKKRATEMARRTMNGAVGSSVDCLVGSSVDCLVGPAFNTALEIKRLRLIEIYKAGVFSSNFDVCFCADFFLPSIY